MTYTPDEQFDAPTSPDNIPLQVAEPIASEPSADDKPSQPMSDSERSLLHKVAEVGEDTVKRLKEIFSEVDRDELRRSVNREQVQRTIASTLDALNKKAQAFLAPKDDAAPESTDDAAHGGTDFSTSPDSPGPVGNEAVHPDEAPHHSADGTPENETRSFV